MRKQLLALCTMMLVGIAFGSLILNPVFVFGQASSGGSGAANTVFVPGLNVNDAYTLPTADGNNGDNLTTNGAGVVTWEAPGVGTDVKAGIDSGATADYVGAASNDGFLRSSAPLTYTDGGNYITLGVTQASGGADGYLSSTDWTTFNNKAGAGANSDITSMTGVSGDIGTPSSVTLANGGALRSTTTTAHTLKIQGYDVDGTAYVDFLTITNGDTPTADLSASVTQGGAAIGTVTSVGAGNGLDFSSITSTGSVVLGTPGSLTPATSNGVTATSHTHEITGFQALDAVRVYTPSGDQSLSAATTMTVSDGIMRVVGNGGAVTSTATPFLTSPASDGTMVIIQGTDDTNTVKIQDESDVAGSELQLKNNQAFTLGNGDIIALVYDSGMDDWLELYRSDN